MNGVSILIHPTLHRVHYWSIAFHAAWKEREQPPFVRVQLSARPLVSVVSLLHFLGGSVILHERGVGRRRLNARVGVWRRLVQAKSQQDLMLDSLQS